MSLNCKLTSPLKKIQKSLVILLMLIFCNAYSQSSNTQLAIEKGKQLRIAVTFKVPVGNKEKFILSIKEIFRTIKNEEKDFFSYEISEDIEHPDTILLYEVWNTSLEEFGQGPAGKNYFKPFLQAVADLGVSRQAHLYKPIL
jgi:quinol monooxygenase YgiN